MKKEQNNKHIYNRIYEIVNAVPSGKVTSYGNIAQAIGTKSSARLVGWALNAAAYQKGIPCHRVVNRNGDLTGKHHFATPNLMKELLISEGVKFNGERVIMSDFFWDCTALELED